MKAISIRLDDRLGRDFDAVCRKAGYKKNTLLTRLIASFVRLQKSRSAVRGKKVKDPFDAVIGIVHSGAVLKAANDIDTAVYDL